MYALFIGLFLFSLQLASSEQSNPPVIRYCYTSSIDWPTSQNCSKSVRLSDSTFSFGDVFQNLLTLDDPDEIPTEAQVLVLQCEAPYPIRWLAEKPVGRVLLVSSGDKNFHAREDDVGMTYNQEIAIPFKSSNFSRHLRCESFNNTEVAAEIYLNTYTRFLDLPSHNPFGTGRGTVWNIFHYMSSQPHFVPCVARVIPGYLKFSRPKILPSAFEYVQLRDAKPYQNEPQIIPEQISLLGHAKYDPRIGFRRWTSQTTHFQGFECRSEQLRYSEVFLPLRKRRRGTLWYKKKTDRRKSTMNCRLVDNSTSSGLFLKFAVCHSILECDLKWKPLAPHVFRVTGKSAGKYQVIPDPGEKIIPTRTEGLETQYYHGFLQCCGLFITLQNKAGELEFLSETDYFFTGLDSKSYLISKGFPSASVIEIKEDKSVEGAKKSTYVCRISTFMLLPNVQFIIGLESSSRPEILIPGKHRLPYNAKIVNLRPEKRKAVTSWKLELVVQPNMKNVTCTSPYIHNSGVVSASITISHDGRNGLPGGAIAGISVTVVVIGALVVLLALLWVKYSKAVNEGRNLTNQEVNEFYLGNNKKEENDEDGIPLDCIPFGKNKIIKATNLELEETLLGEGQFGRVQKGTFNGQPVAVKSPKVTADVEYFKAFLKEIKLMAFIGEHESVVGFLGAVVDKIQERECYAVIELSPFGNLNEYLRSNSESSDATDNLTHETLVGFCKQIATGMEFLSQKKVIHGDMAARNVLVFDRNIVKITDFGLSRKLYNCANYTKTKQAPLPWRWMAIESLKYFDFSTKSDVWSFGVTIWEIFSFGQVPFPGVSWTTDFVKKLESGLRLTPPQNCPSDIFDFMMLCWELDPEKRPSFTTCKQFFECDSSNGVKVIKEYENWA